MAELPSGTVTFLFTDIQGSTRIWEHDAGAMWVALDQHNAILRKALTAHRGYHFKTIGDAFQVAFHDAPSALAAAVDAQRAIASAPWDATGPILVRMALHCGAAQPVDGDYLAPCLNRLARLLSTGYGGQVLLSQAVQQLVRDNLPDDVALRDLGEHRLRDLLVPEHIYQVAAANLPDRFPPLKSLERHPTNLPIQPNAIVGRERELADIKNLLVRDDVRLVTLTGTGGTGKTRLAIQVAAEALENFDDGAFLVDLASIEDPQLVLSTIATTLKVRQTGGESVRDAVVGYLSGRHILLVLDNFEHVLDAAPVISDLLGTCAHLKIVVTSRARISVQAEREYPVQALPIPDLRQLPPLDALATVDAVELFVQRAMTARAGFGLTETNARQVAEICARLDGLPLAIELAAARSRMLSPQAILERLAKRLDLLTGGARDLPVRQQTLRATIEWSYGLLTESQRALFRRLSVFAGGFGFDAAEFVVHASGDRSIDVFDGVTTLVDHSLVRPVVGPDGEPRFTMLETLREYGLERLAELGEDRETRVAHAEFFVNFSASSKPHLLGEGQELWLNRLEAEQENIRLVLEDSSTPEAAARGLQVAGAVWHSWQIRGHLTEGRRWLGIALGHAGEVTSHRLELLVGAGALAHRQADYEQAKRHCEEALDMARELGDQRTEAALLNNLGGIALVRGDLEGAAEQYERCLALSEVLGDRHTYARSLGNLGAVAHYLGDETEATTRYEACLAIWRELGDLQGISTMLSNLLMLIAHKPELAERARLLGEESLEISRRIGDKQGMAYALSGLGLAAASVGELAQASELYGRSLEWFREIEDRSGVARVLGNLGLVALDEGRIDKAEELCRESLVLFDDLGEQDSVAWGLEALGAVAMASDQRHRAARLLGAANALRVSIETPIPPESRPRYERVYHNLMSGPDRSVIATAWELGEGLDQQAAVVEALGGPRQEPDVPAESDGATITAEHSQSGLSGSAAERSTSQAVR